MSISIDEAISSLEAGETEEIILDIDESSCSVLSTVYGAVSEAAEDPLFDEGLHYSESDPLVVERFKAVGTLMGEADCEFDGGFIGDFDGQSMRLEFPVNDATTAAASARLRQILDALADLGIGILAVEPY
jgi:hypothetical protein